jgi:hypothetical protein
VDAVAIAIFLATGVPIVRIVRDDAHIGVGNARGLERRDGSFSIGVPIIKPRNSNSHDSVLPHFAG